MKITDDPNEWHHVYDDVWQNLKDYEAFSNDGGKTYYLLRDGGNNFNREPLRNSEPYTETSE